MKLQVRRRFSIGTMLVGVALIAVTIVVTRDYVRLQSAQEHYNWLSTAWQSKHVSYNTVVAGSYPLMDAEEATLWISKRTAEKRHVERLKRILQQVQSRASEIMPEEQHRQAKHILEQVRSVDPAAADELIKTMTQENGTDASEPP